MDQQNPGQPTQSAGGSYASGQPAPASPHAVASAAGPDFIKRGLALFIDGVIIGCAYAVLAMVLGIPLGWMGRLVAGAIATVAMLVRDVALDGRSPGKKILGMAAVGPDGSPVTLQQSAMRNSTLALGYLNATLSAVPFLGLLSIPLGLVVLAVGLYEIYLVFSNQPRLGDKLAGGTRVIFSGQAAIAI